MANDRLSISIDAVDNASKTLAGIGNAVNSFGDIAKGVFVGGILGKSLDLLGGAVSGVKDAMINGNAEFERYQTQFGVLMGGADKAKERLNMLAEFGAKTPFELPELVKADKVLLSFGLHSDTTAKKFGVSGEQILTTIGDIAAGTGVSFEELSLTFGKFASGSTGDAIARFQELGIATREQMASWGLEFSKAGQLLTPVDKAFGILEQNVRKKFGGMMDAQSQTFEGMVSNFQDWLGQVGRMLGAPIFDALKQNLGGLLAFLGSDSVKGAISGMAAGIAAGITQIIGFLQSLAPYIPPIVAGFVSFGASIQTTFGTISSTLAPFIATIGASLTGLIPSVTSIGASIQQIFGSLIPIALAQGQGAWTMISTTIQTVITSAIAILQTWLPVVQTVLSGIAAFLRTHGEEIQLLVSTAWNTVTSIIQTVINTITEIINAFAPVVTEVFGAISAFLETNGSDILAFLTSAWNSIGEIISGVAAIVKRVVTTVFGEVASFLKTHGDDIQRVLTGAWNFIKVTVGESINIIKGIVNTVLAVINGDWDTAWKNIQSVTESVNKIIQKTIETAMGVIEGVIKLAVDNFKLGWEQGWKLMQDATSAAWETIKAAINTGIETAKTAIANGVEAFMSKFREMRDKMSVIGNQIMEGLIQGIRDKVGWLIDEGVRAGTVVIAAIKNTLGINSPAKEAIPLGEGIDEGLGVGIVNAIGIPVGAAEDMAIQTIERASKALMPIAEVISSAIDPAISQTVSKFSGLADGIEDQLLTVAESFVELAQTGDHTSLLFAQSFDAIKIAFANLVPSFHDVGGNFEVLFQSMANGQFDVESFWKAWDKMLAEIKGNVSTTMPVIQQTVTTTTQNVGAAFDNVLVVAGVAINTLTGEVLSSSDTMSSAMDRLANTVTGATQTMQTQASAAAQAVAASMIAAGQVINMTQQQLANFVQAGGVGGITGSTYTPSPAFQALFTNQPAPAPPPLSSGPTQDTTTNNNNVTVQIDVFGVDERTVKHEMREGILDGLRQSGLSGGMYAT